MHDYLLERGYPFERQFRVERWHIDLALWPVALELERGWTMPHQDGNHEPDTFGRKKYERLLSLLDRGWWVMTMRPPYITLWDEGVQLVVDFVEAARAGEGPKYVSVQQYRHHGHWMRTEGNYADGVLTMVESEPAAPPVKVERLEGRTPCRLKMCGAPALPGFPHCEDHHPIFAERERVKLEAQQEARRQSHIQQEPPTAS